VDYQLFAADHWYSGGRMRHQLFCQESKGCWQDAVLYLCVWRLFRGLVHFFRDDRFLR
jgi:hypothetical protein